jgi:hypothetical protein
MPTLAKTHQAVLQFGDEASFPQWGTFSDIWGRRGHQPQVKTSGKGKARRHAEGNAMSTRICNLWEALRSTFWVVPALMTLAAVALSFALMTLDEAV